MLKNLRRNSKQLFEPRRKSVALVAKQPPDVEGDISRTTTRERTLTFFDLPAELRNIVYEDIARRTRIFIPTPSKKSSKSTPPPPPPSLLLVSRQTRSEFLPLLLEISPIKVVIKDYDFANLTRLISSLYATELRALRLNPALHILLQIDKRSKDGLASLRRWLVRRADGLDRIPFHYGVVWNKHTQIIPTSTQVHKMCVYIQRRTMLDANLAVMQQLHCAVSETLQFELQPVVAALERELANVSTADVESGFSVWQEDSALMMYGMPIRGRHGG